VCCERASGTEGLAAEGIAGEDAIAQCEERGENIGEGEGRRGRGEGAGWGVRGVVRIRG